MAYSPASTVTTTGSLTHLATIHYDAVAVENFKANTAFYEACEKRQLPQRAGLTTQLFGYSVFAANTTPGTEGTVGNGIAPTTVTRSVSLNQYFDFISFSDLLVETAIDDIVENSAAEMGYRAALTVNTLTSTEFENAAGVAGTSIDLADNEFFNAAVARQAVMSLRGQNVKPKADGMFDGLIHPFVAFDLVNDNTAGGVIDILKHVDSGVNAMQRGIQGFRVIELAGVRWIETTAVPTYSNYPSAGKTGYASYVVGKDAIFAVSLENTMIPGEKNFQLIVKTYRDGSVADPANIIRASVAYNFKFAAIRRPGAVMGLRRVRNEASIS